jgi:hypothetical protein
MNKTRGITEQRINSLLSVYISTHTCTCEWYIFLLDLCLNEDHLLFKAAKNSEKS